MRPQRAGLKPLGDFLRGLLAGILTAAVLGAAIIYILNMHSIIAVSVISMPSVQSILGWAYANLRLSIIAFALTAALFVFHLIQLRKLLAEAAPDIRRISQVDHLLDIWINLFFGIGVIWTAIGMRAALLQSIGGLDADAAARLGAFAILKRLVDGGILLALSTTIFGGAGGYLMRVIKSVVVGSRLRDCFYRLNQARANQVLDRLASIDRRLEILCGQRSIDQNHRPPEPAGRPAHPPGGQAPEDSAACI